jgi:hypothetical protein
VGQGIDQRGAQPLSLAGGFHARRSLDGDGARHRDRHLGADGCGNSRESVWGRQASAPMGRNPSISGVAW